MIEEFALTAPTPEPVTLDDIPTIATNSGVHDVLVNALTKADLVSTLQTAGHTPYLHQQIRHSATLELISMTSVQNPILRF